MLLEWIHYISLIVQHYRPRGRRKSSILCNTEVTIFNPDLTVTELKQV